MRRNEDPQEKETREATGQEKEGPTEANYASEQGFHVWFDQNVIAEVSGWVCVSTIDRDAWWMSKGEYQARFG